MRVTPFASSALLLSALMVGHAVAEPIPERARRLAAQGRAAHESGDYDRAIDAFTEANALAPAPPLLFNLAQAYRLKGDCDLAGVMYRRFLATEPAYEERTVAEAHLVTVQPCSAARTTERSRVDAAAMVSTQPVDDASEQGVTQQRIGLGLMIGGGVALAAAAYFMVDARSAESDVEQGYADGRTARDLASIDERGKRSEKLALGLGIGGGVIVASGAVSYVLGRRTERASAFAVAPTKGGAGVSYAWRF